MTGQRARHRRSRAQVLAVAGTGVVVVGAAVLLILLGISRGPSGPPGPSGADGADGTGTVADPPLRIGYVPYWDQERALGVLWEQSDQLDEVSPVWYSVDSTGAVVLADDEHVDVDDDAVREARDRGLRVVPTITNLRDGDWDPEVVRTVLHDPERRRAHIDEIVDLVVTEDYDGIDVDYEHLEAADRTVFSEFLTELGARLRDEGKVLAVAVHPKTSDEGYAERNEAQDYRVIGAAADQVRIMAYDYSWDTSPPGPVAPRDWVEDVVAWAVTQIPAEKIMLGIDLLGYDWVNGHGTTVDFDAATARAQEYAVPIRRGADGTPWLAYRDEHGNEHEIWFEDAESAHAKLELVGDYGLGGAYFWRLGGEDSRVWPGLASVMSER